MTRRDVSYQTNQLTIIRRRQRSDPSRPAADVNGDASLGGIGYAEKIDNRHSRPRGSAASHLLPALDLQKEKTSFGPFIR